MEPLARLKQTMLDATHELIAGCRFSVHISSDCEDRTPIHCVKYSGCAIPVQLNAATCLSCQEYKRSCAKPATSTGDPGS